MPAPFITIPYYPEVVPPIKPNHLLVGLALFIVLCIFAGLLDIKTVLVLWLLFVSYNVIFFILSFFSDSLQCATAYIISDSLQCATAYIISQANLLEHALNKSPRVGIEFCLR